MEIGPEKQRTIWARTAEQMKVCRWLKPVRVAQIEFNEWTDGHLRHSSFVGLRDDKEPLDVVRETEKLPSRRIYLRESEST